MYLKALELQGFKSFPDKTVLTFDSPVTAIVGPNGSGKSNISDAIRWVMGEQSTKALRGGKMEDVIFGGTQKRKQTGFAEVTLVLDNSSGQLDREETEVAVTRRYYRSGDSEYYINRRAVRLRDVNELFMDTGLGREGYSIIGQGKIDEILSVRSGDRREIFEEAAGISRFRHRKEEAERKLQRTQENLVRINDKIDELELQVEPLRQQSEKAKQFLILRDQLRGWEISLWMHQLDSLRASSLKLLSDYEEACRQKAETQAEVDSLYAALETYSQQMHQKDIEAEGIRFQSMGREADANQIQQEIAVRKSQIQNNLEQADRVHQELEAQAGRAGSLSAQIAQREARLADIQTQTAELEGQLLNRQKAQDDLRRNAGNLEAQLEQLRRQANLETASAQEARTMLAGLAALAQGIMDRDESLRQSIMAGESRISDTKRQGQQVQSQLEEAYSQRDQLLNQIQGFSLLLTGRQNRVETARGKQQSLQMEAHAMTSRIRMLSEMEKLYEGYSKAVKLVMGEVQRGQLRGVHGPVAGLIQVPDQYAVAIEIALGGAMQHIVVDREENGKSAIGYLKRREGGRATFLPLSTIRPSQFRDGDVSQAFGFVGMADELVGIDQQYRGVLSNLLGRTVIAEDMDCAIQMAREFGHRFKIVTLDGQVLNPGGSMTGGSTSRSAGILSRANELERLRSQETGLQQQLQQVEAQLGQAVREATAVQYDVDTAQSQCRTLEDSIVQLEAGRNHWAQMVKGLEENQQSLRTELSQLEERSQTIDQDTQAARHRIQALEGTAAALEAEAQGKTAGQSQVNQQLEVLQQAMADLRLQLAALEAEDGASRQSLRELEGLRADLQGDRAQREEMLTELQEKNRQLTGQIGTFEAKLQIIKSEVQDRQAHIAKLNQEKLDLEGQRNQADKDSREKNATLLHLEREVSVLEQKKASTQQEETQILEKMWESYELTHQQAQTQRQELESVSKAQRSIGELKSAIHKLGNINLDAIEEFEKVNQRYTYLTDQRDDVQHSKQELEGVIGQITGEMRNIFAQQFAIINQVFGETFVELFGGGQATLELEDQMDILNCGIEIRVQPPGKALKVLSLLSGGEKAFVAIALYFAILKVHPTPFCVMDEIEAALDDANVTRFARYLRQMAEKSQFVLITHRRGSMEEADVLYGVTMQEQGISRMLTLNLSEVEAELGL